MNSYQVRGVSAFIRLILAGLLFTVSFAATALELVRMGTQPLAVPTGVTPEVMVRHQILRQQLEQLGYR